MSDATSEDQIFMTDVAGKTVAVTTKEFSAAMLSGGVTLFGMDINAIRSLRRLYMDHCGEFPITAKSISALNVRITSRRKKRGANAA